MTEFKTNTQERRTLVSRVSELTGYNAVYAGMPSSEYHIGPYTVTREGNLLANEEEIDWNAIQILIANGLLFPLESSEDDTAEEENAEEEAHEEESPEDSISYTVSVPLANHTGASLRNLIHLLYSRGPALNKSLGTHFWVSKELVDAIASDVSTYSIANLLDSLGQYRTAHGENGYRGFVIDEDRIRFEGLSATATPPLVDAYTQLIGLMNEMAVEQKRIQAKEIASYNEKYHFRIWLIRLGMNGVEYKRTRQLLLQNLDGHSAFRTPEEVERAKEKARLSRLAQKANTPPQEGACESDWESVRAEPESPTQGEPVGNSEGVSEDDAIPMF